MTDFIEVANIRDIVESTMKKVNVGDKAYLLSFVGGKYYCTDLRCPHMGGDLSKGVLKGTIIECPLHHSRFELSDGHVDRWLGPGIVFGILGKLKSPTPLKTYEVKVDGDKIFIKV